MKTDYIAGDRAKFYDGVKSRWIEGTIQNKKKHSKKIKEVNMKNYEVMQSDGGDLFVVAHIRMKLAS